MKTDLMAQTTGDARASEDTASEYSVISAEAPDIENMEKLREKIKHQDIVIRDFETKLTDAENNILNQNEKISLYEATIRDKNDLIKSLNNSIELIKENKELAVNQLKDQIRITDLQNANEQLKDLQNATDLSKNLTSNKEDENAAESAEFEKKPTEIADLQTLQKQFAESQSQIETLKDVICQLKSTNLDLKSKMDENIKQMTILEQKSDTTKTKIAELKNNRQSSDAPFVLLNHSKVPNINFIKIGDKDKLGIVENGWTVILHRFDGSIDFDGTLQYSIGDLSGEFWFGLESIHKLTSSIRHELYIQVLDFDHVTAFARYDNFVVGGREECYALKSLGSYSGNAGDALRSHENAKIQYRIYSGSYGCSWWFSDNNQCCLTGEYKKWMEAGEYDMHWGNWNMGNRNSLKACKMLIKPYKR